MEDLILGRELGLQSKRKPRLRNGSSFKQKLSPVRSRDFATRAWDSRVSRQRGPPPLHQKSVQGHFGCVNSVEFSPGGNDLLGSGGDDKRVLVWRSAELLASAQPQPCAVMDSRHESNIFCLAFDSGGRRLLSSGNDSTVILHDVGTGRAVDVWPWEDVVYTLSQDPSHDDLFAAASNNGRVTLKDGRTQGLGRGASQILFDQEGALVFGPPRGAETQAAYHCPADSRLIATASAGEGAQLWDVRSPARPVLAFDPAAPGQRVQCLTWSSDGRRLATLQRKGQPALYAAHSPAVLARLDHPGYFNSCTMKSLCFAGPRDELLLTGSDDFSLCGWRLPDRPTRLGPGKLLRHSGFALKGHRSIVNQVRYSARHQCVVSSGVEKVVKVWSPWGLAGGQWPSAAPATRPIFTHSEYVRLVMAEDGEGPLPALAEDDTHEDLRMIAFFDSLVQRELEGLSEDSGAGSGSETEGESSSRRPTVMQEVVSSESSTAEEDVDEDEDLEESSSHYSSAASVSGFHSAPEPSTSAYLSDSSDRSTASTTHRPRSQTAERPAVPGPPRGFSLDQNNVLVLDGPMSAADRDITHLVVKRRQRQELEEARRARKRGRYHSESSLERGRRGSAAEEAPSGAPVSVVEARQRVLAAGLRAQESLRSRRLKRMRDMALRLADATASGEVDSSSSDEETGQSERSRASPALRESADSQGRDPADAAAGPAFPRPRRRQPRERHPQQ